MKQTHTVLRQGCDTEGKPVERPLSPHLQVYRPEFTSMSSIGHRLTGIALSAGTLALVWFLAAAAGTPAQYAAMQRLMGSIPGKLVMVGWVVALCYHFLAGIRHLGWDAGYGYDIPRARQTAWLTVIGTAMLTAAILFAALRQGSL